MNKRAKTTFCFKATCSADQVLDIVIHFEYIDLRSVNEDNVNCISK